MILRVPHTEDSSSLSDIMNRMKQRQSTQEPQRDRAQTAVSELSHSMLDLSIYRTEQEEKVNPVPRFRAGVSADVLSHSCCHNLNPVMSNVC